MIVFGDERYPFGFCSRFRGTGLQVKISPIRGLQKVDL